MTRKSKSKNLEYLNRIVPGGLVDVEILTPTNSKRIKTEYIGLLQGQFVILNYPSLKRLPAASTYLREGVVVIVRALLESGDGEVIAFRQTIKSLASHPARMIYLDYPSRVEVFSLRSQTRIPTLIPADLTLAGQNENGLNGIIRDISLTGLLFDAKTQLDFKSLKDTECTVTLSGNIQLKGRIRSNHPGASGSRLGIELNNSETEMQQFLQNHLIDLSVLDKARKQDLGIG